MTTDKNIDLFYKKIGTLSEDQIIDALSYFGPDVLDHGGALILENRDLLAKHVVLSFPWISKILKSKELTEYYLENNIRFFEEQIDDLQLAEVLLESGLLSKFVLSDKLIRSILSLTTQSGARELWIELFTLDQVLEEVDSDEIDSKSIAYEIISKSLDQNQLFISKNKISFLSDEQVAELLEKEYHSLRNFSFSRVYSILTKISNPESKTNACSKWVLDLSESNIGSIIEESAEKFSHILRIIGPSGIVTVLESVRHHVASELIGFLVDNDIPFEMNSAIVESTVFYSTLSSSKSVLSALKIFEQGYKCNPEEAVASLLKSDCEFKEDILSFFKDKIESDNVFTNKLLKYSHIIDFKKYSNPPILSQPESLSVSMIESIPFETKSELLKYSEISEELFDYLIDLSENLSGYHHICFQSVERQEKFFSHFSEKDDKFRFVFYGKKLNSEFLLKLFQEWLDKSSLKFNCYPEQSVLIFSQLDIDSFTQEQLIKIWQGMGSSLAESPEISEKIFRKMTEDSQKKLINTPYTSDSMMLSLGLLTEDSFHKNFNKLVGNRNSMYVVVSSKYYEFCSLEEKTVLANSYVNSLGSYVSGLELAEANMTKFIELLNLADESVFEFLSEECLLMLSKHDVQLKGKKVDSISSSRSDETFNYILKYASENDMEEIVSNLHSLTDNKFKKTWNILSRMLKSNDYRLLDNDSLLRDLLNRPEAKDIVLDYIFNNHNLLNPSHIDIVSLDNKDRIINLLKFLNENFDKISSGITKILVESLKKNIISLKEIVEIVDSRDVMNIFWNYLSHHSQTEKLLVREIRNAKKTHLLPQDYLGIFDLLDDSMSWDFYNAVDYIEDKMRLMTSKQKRIFSENLYTKADSDVISVVNPKLLSTISFSEGRLQKILGAVSGEKMIKLLKHILLDSEAKNYELTRKIVNNDPETFLSKIKEESNIEELLCDLYRGGIKTVFKLKYSGLDLSNYDLMDFFNETKDPFLLKRYLNSWRDLSFSGELHIDIIKEFVRDVKKADIDLSNLSYDKGNLSFEIKETNISLVKARFNHKEKKWIFISGHRPDLYEDVIKFYDKKNLENPEKVSGLVSVDSGMFSAKNEQFGHLSFTLGSKDSENLNTMKDLGVEGVIKATAFRQSNFTYKVEVHFDSELSSPLKSLEREIKNKSFNVNKKLQDLLKINPSRQFGFELELASLSDDRTAVAKIMRKKGHKINVYNSYKKTKGSSWDFKEDGSLTSVNDDYYDGNDYDEDGEENSRSSNGESFEIASPVLVGRDGIKEAEKFLKNLFSYFEIESGEQYNAGLHVHHDIKDLLEMEADSEDIMRHYLPFQEVLYSLVEEWRKESEYCQKINPQTLREGRGVEGASATGVLISQFNTLEFRMKEGLGSTKEILNWIIYTQKIVDAIEAKINNNIKKQQTKIEEMSQSSIYMLLEFMGTPYGKNRVNRLKDIRKIVGLQEKLYG